MQVSIWWVVAASFGSFFLGAFIMCLMSASGAKAREEEWVQRWMEYKGHF